MTTKAKTIHKKIESIDSGIVVKAQNISKKYRLYGSHIHRLKEIFHPLKKKYHKEFWALRDTSFEIRKGETVGFIGRNGSGKSTILQIIAGILTPTDGTVEINGRISALLELGTGFNPELTGRENVYVNGRIMGYSSKDIDQRFAAIEKFADIGEFIDQPVKVYSSGMFVRLAFAAAINVDPDILIIDEALSVGDAKFQNKCFNKFNEFKNKGKTIIFVSHDMDSVTKHCDRVILLEHGNIIDEGAPSKITCFYFDLLFTGNINGFSVIPVLLEESFYGFNLIHYKKKYIALSQSLGEVNLLEDDIEQLSLKHGKNIIASDSLDDLKEQLLENKQLDNESLTPLESEIDKFINSNIDADNCINRKSYNKYEHRIGNFKAEIFDYFIVSSKEENPTVIKSGSNVDIYIKVLSHTDIMEPLFGLIVKDVNGIMIYATNTLYSKTDVKPILKDEIVTFKFNLTFYLNHGDYFITLGLAEGNHVQVDTRHDIVHCKIASKNIFDGIVELPTNETVEVSRFLQKKDL